MAAEGGTGGVDDVAGGLLARCRERDHPWNIWSLLVGDTSRMKDTVAHTGMEAAKMSGLFLSLFPSPSPVGFIETRPASSQVLHTLLANNSRFSAVEGDLKTE